MSLIQPRIALQSNLKSFFVPQLAFPKGGVDKIKKNQVPISIWELRKSRGGLNFSEMSELIAALRHHPKYQK